MEKFLRKYDKECMKMAILRHEETFRQQVHELHRLYKIQKLLVRDVKSNDLKRQRAQRCFACLHGHEENDMRLCLPNESHWNLQKPRQALNLELPADEYIQRAEESGVLEIEPDIDVELTLTIGDGLRKNKERPFTSISGDSFSSTSTESGELKLSDHELSESHVQELSIPYHNGSRNHFEFEEGMGVSRLKQSPWLFDSPNS